jgi:IS5 family transposase
MGIEDRIAYKAKRNKPLGNWQAWFNKTASSVRGGVERANATMKTWRGMARVRYRGLARNHCHLQFVAMAMNMKRARVPLAGGVSRPSGDVRQEVEKPGEMSG